MSADNWAVCPNCKRRRDKAVASADQKVRAAYGNVSAKEYEDLKHATMSVANAPIDQTFREDWEIGITPDGEFVVSYGGFCTTCGAKYSFKHTDPLAVQEKSKARKR